MKRSLIGILLAASIAISGTGPCAAAGPAQRFDFNIDTQPLESALKDFSVQSGIDFYLPLAEGWNAPMAHAVHGVMSPEAALDRILAGSAVNYRFVARNTVRIEVGPRRADRVPANAENLQTAIPEVFVRGRRMINVDIPRTTRDLQPYIVLDREQIERAQAGSTEALIRRLVPANSSGESANRAGTLFAGTSRINLRGLGSDQTLILVDGRRLAAPFIGGSPSQPDLSAIPPAAIERIEILPVSASGIYGGAAAGGVVNIVLRHDCSESRLRVEYGNSLSGDSARQGAFLTHCFSLNDEHTQLQLTGSFVEQSRLLAGERDFTERGRATISGHNPSGTAYGLLPPLGRQVNIVSADSAGLFGPGSPNFTTVPAGYTSTDGIGPLLANAGKFNLEQADSAQADGGRRALLDAPATQYFNGTLTQTLTDAASAFVDFTATKNTMRTPTSAADFAGLNVARISATAPNNPFGRDLIVTVPASSGDGVLSGRLTSKRITVGLNIALPRAWNLGVENTSSQWRLRSNQPRAVAADDDIASGRLDVLRDVQIQPFDFTPYLREFSSVQRPSSANVSTVRMAGPVLRMPAGAVVFSAFLEHRHERFAGGTEFMFNPLSDSSTTTAFYGRQLQSIDSAYAELRVPLGGSGAAAGEAPFEMQFAGRYDRYRADSAPPRISPRLAEHVERSKATFTVQSPTVAFQYRPLTALRLRGSYGTGFTPPSSNELAPPVSRTFPAGTFHDSRRGQEPTGLINLRAGGNSDLEPEKSRTWSAGIILEPSFAPGFNLSVDYVRIRRSSDIVNPADLAPSDLPRFELYYPGRVTRRAPAVGDPYGVGPITAIDATRINAARSRVTAWDGRLQYDSPQWRVGTLHALTLATWEPVFETQVAPSSNPVNQAGVSAGSPLRFSAYAELAFTHQAWTVGWNTRYFNSYAVSRNDLDIQNQGAERVSSQMYHDAFAKYRLALDRTLPDAVDIQLRVQNLFNAQPPFDAGSKDFGYVSSLADPRLVAYSISVTAYF
ncbi:MAG: TonB-dependent receptor [Gammaproteobacteria bacterium]